MKAKGFTLMELMVVVVIIGIIAGFALPQYQKAVRKAHERDAVIQLAAIHAANTMYRATNDAYLPTGAGNLTEINNGLNINVIANDMTYSYNRSATDAFTARAAWDEPGSANDFTVEVDETAINNNNPCCVAGTACPTLSDC